MPQNFLWIALFVLALSLLTPLAQVVQAQDGTTPLPAAEVQPTTALPWFVPVIFFALILVGGTFFKQWLAKGTKKKFTGGSCCAPLVDEDRKA